MWMAEVGVDSPNSMEHSNPLRADGRLFSVLAKEPRRESALPSIVNKSTTRIWIGFCLGSSKSILIPFTV